MAKHILIDSSYGLIRTAISQGGRLLDYYEESPDQGRSKGNIYKGIIKNVDAHIQAAFVRYGGGRDGFLPLRDVPAGRNVPSRSSAEPPAEAAPEKGKRRRKGRGKGSAKEEVSARPAEAPQAPGPGDAVLVQVVKDEVGGKGAALTTKISLSGRYLVYMPGQEGDGGVSSRLSDEERAAMKAALAELQIPKGASVILRTAAAQRTPEELQADLDRLIAAYRDIEEQAYDREEPGLLHRDLPPASRYLREYCTPDVERIWVNSEELLAECREFFELYEPKAAAKVQLAEDGAQMFQRLGLEAEVERLASRKVSLPSGANFVIDQTEALVAIDVNSAKSKSDGNGREGRSRDLEDTVFAINMEAGAEIARQLRLRDLGGIIIVDFIDMEEDRHRRKVEEMMRRALSADKAKVKVFDITPLGLMQISRQRLRKAGPHFSRTACSACQGRGWQSSPAAAALSVLRRVEERMQARKGAGHVSVTVPYPVANHLHNEFRAHVEALERKHGCAVRILADANPSGEAVFGQPQEQKSGDVRRDDPGRRRPDQARSHEGRPQREQGRRGEGRRPESSAGTPESAEARPAPDQGRGKGRRDRGRRKPEAAREAAPDLIESPRAETRETRETREEWRESIPADREAEVSSAEAPFEARGAEPVEAPLEAADGVERAVEAQTEGGRARRGRGRGRRGGRGENAEGKTPEVPVTPTPAASRAAVAPRPESGRRRQAPPAKPEARPKPEPRPERRPEPVAVAANGEGKEGNGRRRRRRGGRGNRGGGNGNPQAPKPAGPRPQGPIEY